MIKKGSKWIFAYSHIFAMGIKKIKFLNTQKKYMNTYIYIYRFKKNNDWIVLFFILYPLAKPATPVWDIGHAVVIVMPQHMRIKMWSFTTWIKTSPIGYRNNNRKNVSIVHLILFVCIHVQEMNIVKLVMCV